MAQVERVRFSKDGSQLQLTAIDGRRATVVLPNDPDLVDILAKNGVDISVRWPCMWSKVNLTIVLSKP